MDDIYSAKILQHAGNVTRLGVLPDADASASAHSRLCGSKLTVYLNLADGRVSGFSHELKACALGQASSAIMAETIIGATPAEIRDARDKMRVMLKEGGEGPDGRFAEMRCLLPVKDYPARHGSVMLTFEATVKALDALERGPALAEAVGRDV
ncbi:iron-sulfur cluster assembly scaffold protein [Martelella mediterranea]|uniref:SUF system FeS assembly protein, NifU family n=1 Tax=Martelella mediterranea DSM 17316 TaxID=1122214 RepID=A0A1U9Z6K1_9HYPH|nr:iron-sulfur cluster assembly scaffold protein [Martelella mediterranea]AQZ53311.1 SUF system FeS assembly protein, NifU family [Martelella mediterranea DSM 17316]